jgi:capsular exopolysaccharide synthesis family protein
MPSDTYNDFQLAPQQAGANNLPSTDIRDALPQWDAEEIHLRDYLEVLVRRKWLIISTLLLTFVTTLLLTLAQPKLYQAATTLEVVPQNQNVTKFEAMEGSDPRASDFYDTQVQLLESRELQMRVAERLQLDNHPVVIDTLFDDDTPGLLARLKGMLRELVLSFIPKDRRDQSVSTALGEEVLRQESVLTFMAENLEVVPGDSGMLIDVTFISPDRQLSRDVANALADEFVQWKMEQKLESSDLARSFLMKQIDRAKINLEQAEEKLNQFAEKAGIVSLDAKQNGVYRQLEDLNAALSVAEAELIDRQASYNQAVKEGSSTLPEVMASSMIGELKTEYARLKSEYEKQHVAFKDDYPEVRALLGRMDSIAKRIAEEEKKIFATVRNQFEAAAAKKAALEKRVDEQRRLAMDLNQRTTQYKIMAREVETNKQIYQSLLERSREIESMAGISSSNIHIVDRASLPILPAKPNVKRNLLLAVVLGLFTGVGLAFFLNYFTDHVTNPDEISDRFRIPILGVLPLVKEDANSLYSAMDVDPRSPFSEAMRTTSVSIQLSGAEGQAKSFVITSTRPGEGKTTLASNLAKAFSTAGEKVVLVDADMRRPRLHKILGANGNGNGNGPGLSRFLANSSEPGLVRRHGDEELRFIPAGPTPPNPAELLVSKRFSELIRYLEAQYDRVIVDGPPLMGFADTLVLSRNVGGVVLVSTVGQTTREELRHFKKLMGNVNSTILGCIINRVDLTKRYGYQSYYKYYNYYSYGDQGAAKRARTKALPT